MELLNKLKPQIDEYNLKIQTCCVAKANEVQEVARDMENLAVRCLICILANRGVFDRNKHKTLTDLYDALIDYGLDIGTFFGYFVEEYLDGLRTHDEDDFPDYNTIELARQELMTFYTKELSGTSSAS